jgi:RNase P subunit RPR2
MNRELMKTMGFKKEVSLVERGLCPWCEKPIHPEKDFRDEKSREEYRISGLCQTCQDEVFK